MFGASYDYGAWLEHSSLAWIVLSSLASLGSNTGYSVAIGAFVLLNALQGNRGRALFISGGLSSLCIIVDTVYLSLHGGTLSSAGHEYGFALAMIIISLFTKGIALYAVYMLSVESGLFGGAGSSDYASYGGSSGGAGRKGPRGAQAARGGADYTRTSADDDADLAGDGYGDDDLRDGGAAGLGYQSSSAAAKPAAGAGR